MGRTAGAAQQARSRARERMNDLERERHEQQKRIEDAATTAYLALEKRATATILLHDAEDQVAAGLRATLAEESTSSAPQDCAILVKDAVHLGREHGVTIMAGIGYHLEVAAICESASWMWDAGVEQIWLPYPTLVLNRFYADALATVRERLRQP